LSRIADANQLYATLVEETDKVLRKIYRPGYQFVKAGIFPDRLIPEDPTFSYTFSGQCLARSSGH